MSDEILRRVERDAGVPGLVSVLAERLAPTDLRSLLLAVARIQAGQTTPADVLRRYESDPFVRPADIDASGLAALEHEAVALLPGGFQLVELSPVCPLGTSSVLGGVSQDWVVTASRGGEVVSDPTNVLALEAALRRRRDRTATVRLCASHRTVRAQRFSPPLSPHFRLLALCAAGRAGQEDELVEEQIEYYRRILDGCGAGPTALDREPRKPAYYAGATFGISTGGLEVVEGGVVDWTSTLLADRKERLVISGIGLDLLGRIVASTRR